MRHGVAPHHTGGPGQAHPPFQESPRHVASVRHNCPVPTPVRYSFVPAPDQVLIALSTLLSNRGYEITRSSTWQLTATRGSVGKNVLLGGFAQRMAFVFTIYSGENGGSIVEGAWLDDTSSMLLGGGIGVAKTNSELTAIFVELGSSTTGSPPAQ